MYIVRSIRQVVDEIHSRGPGFEGGCFNSANILTGNRCPVIAQDLELSTLKGIIIALRYLSQYRKALPVEKAAIETL